MRRVICFSSRTNHKLKWHYNISTQESHCMLYSQISLLLKLQVEAYQEARQAQLRV
jgi:hypothetical protein